MLTNVASRNLEATVLGKKLVALLLLAPVGVLSIVHHQAELAVARTAAALGVPMLLSTLSSHSIEEVANVMGPCSRWFQLYCLNDPASLQKCCSGLIPSRELVNESAP